MLTYFVGTVISLIFIFLTLQFPKGGVNLDWWGNTVFMNSASPSYIDCRTQPLTYPSAADYKRSPLRSVPEGGIPSAS